MKKYLPKCLLMMMPLVLCGCKDKLYVSNQHLSPDYLASSYVGSPDPSAEHFDDGVQLYVSWRVSKETLEKHPQLVVDVIFGDLTEQRFEFIIAKRSDFQTIRLLEPVFSEKKGILTFRAEIITENKDVIAEWKHQLWTPLLHIDGETI